MSKFCCAAVQMASGPNVSANLMEAGRLVAEAAHKGARLVVLPENFAIMGMAETDKLAVAEHDGEGPIQEFLARTAQQYGVWIVGGTMPVHAETGGGKVRAACLVFDAEGRRVARYDKIHLFDVKVPGTDEVYAESATIDAGDSPLILDTPFGRLGVVICYDLRFPELLRQMAAHGLDLIVVPAAFTARTGAAHWDLLVRARAVENLCFVIAANQGGFHLNGRETYGHSMIVDPWGQVVSQLPQGTGVVAVELDSETLARVRAAFPALDHRRLFCDLPRSSAAIREACEHG